MMVDCRVRPPCTSCAVSTSEPSWLLPKIETVTSPSVRVSTRFLKCTSAGYTSLLLMFSGRMVAMAISSAWAWAAAMASGRDARANSPVSDLMRMMPASCTLFVAWLGNRQHRRHCPDSEPRPNGRRLLAPGYGAFAQGSGNRLNGRPREGYRNGVGSSVRSCPGRETPPARPLGQGSDHCGRPMFGHGAADAAAHRPGA